MDKVKLNDQKYANILYFLSIDIKIKMRIKRLFFRSIDGYIKQKIFGQFQ
jgi:hypothetical protein